MEERKISPNIPRRRTQFILLVIAVLMLVLGFTIFSRFLQGVGLLIYYLACMVLTLTAMLLAARDMREIRRQNREEKIGLMEQAFDDVSAEVKEARDKRRPGRRT